MKHSIFFLRDRAISFRFKNPIYFCTFESLNSDFLFQVCMSIFSFLSQYTSFHFYENRASIKIVNTTKGNIHGNVETMETTNNPANLQGNTFPKSNRAKNSRTKSSHQHARTSAQQTFLCSTSRNGKPAGTVTNRLHESVRLRCYCTHTGGT